MSAGLRFGRWLSILLGAGLLILLTGCAHPITLAGDASALMGVGKTKLNHSVGLVIRDEDRKREVVTPGGGGDKLSYLPYRDLETGLYLGISEAFTKVVRLNSLQDPKVKAESLRYIITPEITTTSYSPSLVTWPPTVFTVELACKVSDAEGKAVTAVRVLGEGRAEFDEFKSDFSLAAKRAADDALRKLVQALAAASETLR